jgi:hypothetical protein
MDATQPTARQIAYAKSLGIWFPSLLTRSQLSSEMDAVLGRNYNSGRFVKQRRPRIRFGLIAGNLIKRLFFFAAVGAWAVAKKVAR